MIASIIIVLIVLSLTSVYTIFTGRLAQQQTAGGEQQAQELTRLTTTLFKIEDVRGQSVILKNIGQQVLQPGSVRVSLANEQLSYTMSGPILPGETGTLTLRGLWRVGRGRHFLEIRGTAFGDGMTVEVDVVKEGLYQDLRLDEGEGTTVIDSSGNGRHGTFLGQPTWTDGKFGKALSFDGIDDGVNMLIKLGTYNRFTVEAWANPSNITTTNNNALSRGWVIGGPSLDGRTEFVMGWSNQPSSSASTAAAFYWGGSGWPSTPGKEVPNAMNSWHHLVFVYDNFSTPRGRYYYDGSLIGTITEPKALSADSASEHWRIASVYGDPYKGIVDEVRIYVTPLTPDEIYVMKSV